MNIPAILRMPRNVLVASALLISGACQAENFYYFTKDESGIPNGGDGTWDAGITRDWAYAVSVGSPQYHQDWSASTVWVNGYSAVFDDIFQVSGADATNGGLVTVSGPVVANQIIFYPLQSEHYTLQGAPSSNITASVIKLGLPATDLVASTIAAIKTQLIGNISVIGQAPGYNATAQVGRLQLQGTASNLSLNITISAGPNTPLQLELQKTGGAWAVNNLTVSNGDVSSDQSEQIGGILTLDGGNFFNRPGATNTIGIFNGSGGTMHNFAGATLNLNTGVFSGNISSDGTINVNSTNSLTLGGTNRFGGPLNLVAGELKIPNSGSLGGAGSLHFSGGKLSVDGGMGTIVKDVSIVPIQTGQNAVVKVPIGASLTFQGAVVGGALATTGPGTFRLTGNTDNASLILQARAGDVPLGKSSGPSVHAVAGISEIATGATVYLSGGSGDNQIYDGDPSGPYGLVNLTGGTLEMFGVSEGWDRLTGPGKVINTNSGTSTVTLGLAGGTSSFAGQLAEANGAKLSLVKAGSGTLSLSGTNNFTGGTIADRGLLYAESTTALGAGPLVVNSAGQVIVSANLSVRGLGNGFGTGSLDTGVVNSANNSVLTIIPNFRDFPGSLGGSLGLTVLANELGNYQVLSGPSNYTGPTIVNGNLSITNINALGAISGGTTVNSGGILSLFGGFNAARTFAAEPLTMSDGSTLLVSTSDALRDATWQGPITLSGGTAIIRAVGANAGSLAVTGTITGAGNVRIEGNSGPVIFSGAAKTLGGTTTIGSGTLTVRTGISGPVALGDAATGGASTRLFVDGLASFSPPITVAATGGPAIIEAANLPGLLVLDVNGPVTLNRPTTFQLSQGNEARLTFNGKISGNVGTLTIQGRTVLDGSVNDFTGDIVVTAGSLLQAGLGQSELIPDTAAVTLNAGSRLAITGPANETIRALRGSGGVVDTRYAYVQTLGIALPSGMETFGGVLQNGGGPLALTKTGAGRQILTGLNTYTGATLVNGGMLEVGGGGSLYTGGTGAGSIAVGNGGTFSFGRNDTFGGHTSNSPVSIVVKEGGLLTNGSFFNTLRNVNLNGGELRASGGASATFPGFQLKGTVTTGGTVLSQITALNAAVPEQAIQLGDNTATGVTTFAVADTAPGADLRVSAVVADGRSPAGTLVTSGLLKTGAGTMELLAANTFTGRTTINAGTLAVKGSITGGATVNTGGTLGGTGTVNGGLTVNAGGTVAQTSGTLIVNGAITNNGTIRFTGGAALNANGATSFVNNGVVDIINGSAQFPANFSNGANGLVLTPSSVKVKSAAKNGNTVSIHIDSYSGHTFRLQRTGSLTQAFTDIGTVQNGATGTTLTFTDNNATDGQGFYRVAVD